MIRYAATRVGEMNRFVANVYVCKADPVCPRHVLPQILALTIAKLTQSSQIKHSLIALHAVRLSTIAIDP